MPTFVYLANKPHRDSRKDWCQHRCESIAALTGFGCQWQEVGTGEARQSIFDELCRSEADEGVAGLIIEAHLIFAGSGHAADNGGIELFKHLRFAPVDGPHRDGLSCNPDALERLTRVPVLILTEGYPELYACRPPENLILLAPGCKLLSHPAAPAEIASALRTLRRFADRKTLQRELLPYIAFNDGGGGSTQHGYRNKAGVGKFLHEFAGHVLDAQTDPVRQRVADIEDAIWLKMMRFKEPDLEWQAAAGCNSHLADKCCAARVLYVDDNHSEGWSYGLFAGLYLTNTSLDQSAKATYLEEVFSEFSKQKQQSIEVGRGSFLCSNDGDWIESGWIKIRSLLQQELRWWAKVDQEVVDNISSGEDATDALGDTEKAQNDIFQFPVPELFFLDLRLKEDDEHKPVAEISGIEILRRIKKKQIVDASERDALFPFLPVIMMTASQKGAALDEAQRLGVSKFWTKGSDSGLMLWQAIDKAIDEGRTLQPLWVYLEMLRLKQTVFLWPFPDEQRSNFDLFHQAVPIEQVDADIRNDITGLLVSSLHILAEAVRSSDADLKNQLSSQVITNMAYLQEKRFMPPRFLNGMFQSRNAVRSAMDAAKNNHTRNELRPYSQSVHSFINQENLLRNMRSSLFHADRPLSEQLQVPHFRGNSVNWQSCTKADLLTDSNLLQQTAAGYLAYTIRRMLTNPHPRSFSTYS